jgi:hypothetical protein
VEYIHKDKAQKIYKDIAEKQFIMAFFKEMPLDKLKKLISFKETDPDKEEWKNKDQVEMLCHLRDTNSLLLSCHLEIGPKPVDDTFTLNFAEWLRKESYDVGDKWYYQQDNELYTSAGMLSIYRVLSVDKNKISHGS